MNGSSSKWLALGLVAIQRQPDSGSRRRKATSQKDLAAELGVSQSLVSQVLNGSRQFCRPDLYAKIWALALERHYSGRGLRREASPF